MSEVNPGILVEARDFLKAAVISRDGKPIDGEPVSGPYTIGMKKNMTFHGTADYVSKKLLPAAFPGCEFTWAE